MKSSLLSIVVAGLTAAAPAPSSSTEETCNSLSTQIREWTIKDFDYRASYTFSTPSHQIAGGYVNFTLENQAVDYQAICTASSNWLSQFFYGNIVYNCTVPQEADRASFTFNWPTGEVRVNQTWNCLDEGSYYIAEGGVELDLDCEDETWQNPDWQPGQMYSVRTISCQPVTTTCPIESIRGVA
ncbi:hypothetical protein S40285_03499 [Stachybotrys chlorohalonatus IBT 40285]|uniref:AA1-like domain-containing protein n=1 Tax=Stachybotrys chlorohalonatus (strain IBT 40285) TaxID=1283841 RepID=A0A084QCJ5_STAC4|nr:hypothetical protein S40285_03499 [Stachybotrys chlorohalonata IBT 40285]